MTSTASIAVSFAEGLALILSPCILPVLPLILGASLEGSKAKPLGIVAGFVLAFTAFAWVSRQAILASGISSEVIRDASLILLMLFGLVMLFPRLSDKWAAWFARLGGGSDALIGRIKGDGFISGMGVGALIGVVWTPCAGPIMATALLQIIQAGTTAGALAIIAAFALGAAIPMFIIATSGRYFMHHLHFLKKHSDTIRRTIGVVMIAAALTIFSGFDLKLVAWGAKLDAAEITTAAPLENNTQNAVTAPELVGITDWVNTPPLTLQQLRGKVVLIDFWTYSCINCIRTMPYITGWYEKYKNDGLVIIGVHSPEFPFEKKLSNVKDAVNEYGITYPVALDNNFSTWKAFKNQYWPAHYLINRDGRIVYTHFGEGNYAETENSIRAALGLDAKVVSITDSDVIMQGQSPETYLGYNRAANFKSPEGITPDKLTTYTYPAALAPNAWALTGNWKVAGEKITSGTNAGLRFRYIGGKVFLVLGSVDGKPLTVDVLVDGTKTKTISVTAEKLYTLVDTPAGAAPKGLLELRVSRAGLDAYAFTFGK